MLDSVSNVMGTKLDLLAVTLAAMDRHFQASAENLLGIQKQHDKVLLKLTTLKAAGSLNTADTLDDDKAEQVLHTQLFLMR